MFLYIDPIKQGLKLQAIKKDCQKVQVFIHRSIKTRIETLLPWAIYKQKEVFLYIDPLKQGLKPRYGLKGFLVLFMFLYIDPLKQGLKPDAIARNINTSSCFYT